MGRKATDKYLSDFEVEKKETEEMKKIERSANAKAEKDVLDNNRENFIKQCIQFNEEIEDIRISNIEKIDNTKKTNTAASLKDLPLKVEIPRAKNLSQSLVYLLLNDEFYGEITSLRKKLNIPQEAFPSKEAYEQWTSEYGQKSPVGISKDKVGRGQRVAMDEIVHMVSRLGLCHERDVARLSKILYLFLTRQSTYEEFFGVIAPLVLSKRYETYQSGFDTEKKEYPVTSEDFYKYTWTYKAYPFESVTDFSKRLKDYYLRETINEQNYKDGDSQYAEYMITTCDAYSHKDILQKEAKLIVTKKADSVTLEFTTNFFTKASDIIKLVEQNKDILQKMIQELELNYLTKQKRFLSENFSRNCRIYILQKKGLTHNEINFITYKEGIVLEGEIESIKGELGEFKDNVKNAERRKIIFR